MVQLVASTLKIATIAVLAGLVALGGSRFFDYYQDQNAVAGVGEVVSVKITDDDDTNSVAAKLHDKGLIRYEYYFKGLMQVSRKDFVPKTYKLRKGMTTSEIIDAITTGTVKKQPTAKAEDDNQVVQLTVIEGYRTEQIADTLDELGYKPGGEAFLEAVKNYPSDRYDFLKDRPDPESLEGYLFPDTYDITLNEDPNDIIQKMLDNFDNKFAQDMRDRAGEMGLSINEVLIFASLVEREVQYGPERPIVADVYIKRFQEGWTLDADPTIQYALGKKGDWWPKLGTPELETESPYNTYLNQGLPPGPICNPGADSIAAIFTPAETPYYYFIATLDGSGKHLFGQTIDEQRQNAAYIQEGVGSPAPGSDPFGPDSPVNVAQ
jgi:UPF0755 protein